MTELKQISKAAIPSALAKADKYRLLNEPAQAESICRDVLAVDGKNQEALVTLLLSLTDQFHANSTHGVKLAEETLAQLADAYERAYYAGIICERWARALLAGGDPGRQALDWLDDAMRRYDDAARLGQEGNDDPILRWNACARTIAGHQLAARPEHAGLDGGD
jgi:hypothetical protein